MSRNPSLELKMSGRERATFGATFSLRLAETGELKVVSLFGPVMECARRCAALIDDSGEDWRVVCVSTPNSIFRDLQGGKHLRGDPGSDPRSGKTRTDNHEFDPLVGERHLMGRIGRKDLLPHVSNRAWMAHER